MKVARCTPSKSRSLAVGILVSCQVGASQFRIGQIGIEQIRPAQIRPAKIGPGQVGADQKREIELGPGHVSALKPGRPKIGLVQVRVGEVTSISGASRKVSLFPSDHLRAHFGVMDA